MSISPSFDLAAYLAHYDGQCKLDRLLFIASNFESHRSECLKQLLTLIKQTKGYKYYQRVHQNMESYIGELGPAFAYDQDYVAKYESELKDITNRLESDMVSFKSSNTKENKESLRKHHIYLGETFTQYGEWGQAIQSFNRLRDSCTTPEQFLEMYMHVAQLSLQTTSVQNVLSYVDKAERLKVATPSVKYQLKCYESLAHLAKKNFKKAATGFVNLEYSHYQSIKGLITKEDIAIYGGIAALAEFSRAELKALLWNTNFKLYLEEAPDIQALLQYFYNSKYKELLNLLKKMEDRLRVDMYMSKSVDDLCQMIRKKSIIQYFTPYEVVDLATMAETFVTDVPSLEKEISKMVIDQSLSARIDSHNKKLIACEEDSRSNTFELALDVSEKFLTRTRDMLLRLNMRRYDVNVQNTRGFKKMDSMDLLEEFDLQMVLAEEYSK